MDFAWAINALKAGQKVTRKIWAGDPSYIELTAPGSNSIIAVSSDTQVENWMGLMNSDILADDWEEYKAVDDLLAKLPKLGSMENCEKLSKAINQLLETVTSMPNFAVTVEQGPDDKQFTVTVTEKEG